MSRDDRAEKSARMEDDIVTLPVLSPTSCDGCGACCRGIGSPVLLFASNPDYCDPHPFRPPNLPRHLIDEIDFHFSGLRRGQEPLAACLWYDEGKRRCKHYDYRPQICREYELGGAECLRERRSVEQGEAGVAQGFCRQQPDHSPSMPPEGMYGEQPTN